MIYRNEKDPIASYHNKKIIAAVYYNLKTIWANIRSCFGKGFWINEYPWADDDGWHNTY